MNKYGITGQENAVTASLTTALALIAAATSRPEIYYLGGSAGGTMADGVVRHAMMDFTAAPTVTAVTPTKLDPAAVAAVATAGENASAEGTYTAGSEKLDKSVHLRSPLQWWAMAETDRIIAPATASNGLGSRVSSGSYTGAWDAEAHFVGP